MFRYCRDWKFGPRLIRQYIGAGAFLEVEGSVVVGMEVASLELRGVFSFLPFAAGCAGFGGWCALSVALSLFIRLSCLLVEPFHCCLSHTFKGCD